MSSIPRHNVYVVKLKREVLDIKKFRLANPKYKDGKPCVYVGMTGVSPERRFDNHKKGIKANRFVRDFGIRLMPKLYKRYNRMSYKEACDREKRLAKTLRNKGYAVWQH